jgi:hypothetical protein
MNTEENAMRNRYGDEYSFEKVAENTYKIVGDLSYWRFGGKEGQEGIDESDLGFVDPSGGPFIAPGYEIEGSKVVRISSNNEGIFFEVE